MTDWPFTTNRAFICPTKDGTLLGKSEPGSDRALKLRSFVTEPVSAQILAHVVEAVT